MMNLRHLVKLGEKFPYHYVGIGGLATGLVASYLARKRFESTIKDRIREVKRRRTSLENARQIRTIAGKAGLQVAAKVDKDKTAKDAFDASFVPRIYANDVMFGMVDYPKELVKPTKKGIGAVKIFKGAPPEVVYHEIGHAMNEQKRPKAWRWAKGYGLLGLGGASGVYLVADRIAQIAGKDLIKNPKAKVAAELGFGGTMLYSALDTLREEHRASKNALTQMENAGFNKKELAKAKKTLDNAYSTYLAGSLIPLGASVTVLGPTIEHVIKRMNPEKLLKERQLEQEATRKLEQALKRLGSAKN